MILTDTDQLTPAQRAQAEARQMYLASCRIGAPLTGVELGQKFERTERWGQARIQEAKVEAASTPAVISSAPAATSLPPVAVTPPTAESETPEATAPELKRKRRRAVIWPVLLLMLPATVAIWSGWVGLGQLAGFGPINPLPGIVDGLTIDTSITLPIGMETYSAYALYVWLSGRANARAIAFARVSALIALAVGAAGQIAYHLMSAAGVPAAHPLITAAVSCIPVAVLGLGAALAHLVKHNATDTDTE